MTVRPRIVGRAFALLIGLIAVLLGTPAQAATDNSAQYWQIETTAGRVVVQLRNDIAPNSVRQMKRLIEAGVYDGLRFTRVIPGFVAQVGQVDAPADRLQPLRADQSSLLTNMDLEASTTLPHRRGVVSLAHLDGDVNSARSSFSFVLADSPHLDGQYTAFGEVVVGQDVIDVIQQVPVVNERPTMDVVMISSRLSATIGEPTGVLPTFVIPELPSGQDVTLWIGSAPIVVRFFDDSAPQHAQLIRSLMVSGAYNASSVGRIAAHYVQVFPFVPATPTRLPVEGRRPHRRGYVTMSDVDSTGETPTGFTIVLQDNAQLDDSFTPFAEVVSGIEQLDALAATTRTNGDAQPMRSIGISTAGPMAVQPAPDTQWSFGARVLVALGTAAAGLSIVAGYLNRRRTGIAILSLGVCCATVAAWTVVPVYESTLMSSALFLGSIGVFRLMSKFEAPEKRAATTTPPVNTKPARPAGTKALLGYLAGATMPEPANNLDANRGADGQGESEQEGLGVVVTERLPADVTQ
jgi:cyclophilin family peptidyl-prolyl cis-trans isomerase